MGFLDDLTSDLQTHLDTNQATKDFSQDIPIVDLETFLYHEDYLKIPFRISDKQLDFLKSMDDNFEDIGTSKYNLAMLVWGKGSGKDFISGVLALRTIYKLLCYADPRETFRRTSGGKISIAPGDQISILNVAVNAEQAKGVYFDKLCGLVKNAGDKAFKRFGFDFDRDVKSGKILFPKELVIVSGHSRQEAMEGRNLIMATLDEISAFKTEAEMKSNPRGQMSAQAIYDVLNTSINTRFPFFGKIVMISYPRFKGDFLLTKYEESEKLKLQYPEIGIYLSKGATWEINTTKSKSDKAIAEDYQKNPEKAAQFYECIAPDTEDPYFRLKEKIHRAYETQEVRNPFNPLGGYDVEFRAKNTPYVVHLDLAFNGDRAALAMSHVEGTGDNRKFYTDLIKCWKAEPNKEIDLQLIEDEIKFLKQRGFGIVMVSYDNVSLSKFLIQRLEKAGFKTEYSSVDRGLAPYENFKEILYKEQFKTYYDEIFTTELLGLTLINGRKVDHLATGSKDLADAVVGSIFTLVALKISSSPRYFRGMF